MDIEQAIAVIDEHLNGHGRVIAEESEKAGLDLALACALVEQESGSLGNVFGCDHGSESPYEPPYCRVRVTAERVGLLLLYVGERSYWDSNGVGLTQLTYPPLIRDADTMGGAHRPRIQCRLGFQILKDYVEHFGLRRGLGNYNGGPTSPNYAYAWDVIEKRNEWRRRLKWAT